MTIFKGDALDLIQREPMNSFDLIVTDPPYAFGGSGDEHEISATVAIVLRESAMRLKTGRFMAVMCASSWRSIGYMAESVRHILTPIRVATWCKPESRTKVRTVGWSWASVSVVLFRKGKALDDYQSLHVLDNISAPVIKNGRRAELPPEVADWMVAPFAVAGGRFLDPFAGSGAIVSAASRAGMSSIGFEKNPLPGFVEVPHPIACDLDDDDCSCGEPKAVAS